MAVTIYTLSDPRTGEVRYVGVTHGRLNQRLSTHLADGKANQKSHRSHWIGALLKSGLRPVIAAIETVTDGTAFAREREVIAEYRLRGFRLVNNTDGGEGALGRRHTDDAKARISACKKGVKLSAAHVKAIAEAQQGRMPPAHVVDASIARFKSAAHKEKVARAQQTPAMRAIRSAQFKGVPKTSAHRASLSIALSGRRLSQEQRDQMVAHHRTPEYRARLAEIKRQWWAAKKSRQEVAYV
jgi:hypothetical protein